MTTQTQPRKLERGSNYAVGEKVLDPMLGTPRLVFDNFLERTVLIDCEVKEFHREDSMQVSTYNCVAGSGKPEIVSNKTHFELDQEFPEYKNFIEQHGGNQ